METFDYTVRFTAVALLLGSSLYTAWRFRTTLAGRMAALLLASLAAYSICSSRTLFPTLGILQIPVSAGCIAVPMFFWWFSRAFFDDSFRVHPWQVGLFLLLQLNGLWPDMHLPGQVGIFDAARWGIYHVSGLGLVFWAIFEAMRDRENDLVESRRPIRWLIVTAGGAYVALVLTVELVFRGERAPAELETFNVVGILVLTAFLYFRLHGELARGAPGQLTARNPVEQQQEPPKTDPVDRAALDAILHAMEREFCYRESGMTIGSLAEQLDLQEHRLRRLINQHLGYRNFNAFLNHYRIAEAREKLADLDMARTPVLTIALDLGYRSLSPFNRAFKEATGQTPSEYRSASLAETVQNPVETRVDSEKTVSISESA